MNICVHHRYHRAQPDTLARFWALQQPWPGASAIASFPRHLRVSEALDGSARGKARGSGRCGSFAYSCAALQLHLDSSATECSCAYSCAARCATGAATRPTCKLEQCARCLDSRAGCRPDRVRLRSSGAWEWPNVHMIDCL